MARSSTFACRPHFLEPGEGDDLACQSRVYTQPPCVLITRLRAGVRRKLFCDEAEADRGRTVLVATLSDDQEL